MRRHRFFSLFFENWCITYRIKQKTTNPYVTNDNAAVQTDNHNVKGCLSDQSRCRAPNRRTVTNPTATHRSIKPVNFKAQNFSSIIPFHALPDKSANYIGIVPNENHLALKSCYPTKPRHFRGKN